jgi:hypothetical protein
LVLNGTKHYSTATFTFSESKKGIREAKIAADLDAKRAAEAAAATYKFKAMPIAPATADLGLFNRIMMKNEKRRKEEHDKKAAYVRRGARAE